MKRGKEVVVNFIWRLLERVGAQLVSFLVSIILARLLEPEDFGIIALATVFISILNVFADYGMGNSLIQKIDSDDLDYSTAFWSNIIICCALYGVVFCLAPCVAEYYGNDFLCSIIRVMGLSIIPAGIKNIQHAVISRRMQFKKFFFATSIGTATAALVGVVMAINGCGVWALAIQYVLNITIDTLVLSVSVNWKPRLVFSLERFLLLHKYGVKLLASAILSCAYDNFRQLIIGKRYSSSALAYYNRGKQIPSLLIVNINSSLDSVLFPVMSEEQESKDNLRSMTRNALEICSFLLIPLLIGIATTSSHLVPLLLTSKWNSCIEYVVVFCVFYSFYPLQTTNLNVIKAVGRSDLFFKLELAQTLIGIALLLPVISMGPLYIAYMYLIASFINSIIIGVVAGRQINYGLVIQLKDIIPYYAMSIVMGILVYLVGLLSNSNWIVIAQIVVGIGSYWIMCTIFRPAAYSSVCALLFDYKTNEDFNGDNCV